MNSTTMASITLFDHLIHRYSIYSTSNSPLSHDGLHIGMRVVEIVLCLYQQILQCYADISKTLLCFLFFSVIVVRQKHVFKNETASTVVYP